MAPPKGVPRAKSPATEASERATFDVYRAALEQAKGVQRKAATALKVSPAAVGQFVRNNPSVMDGLKRRKAGRPDGAVDAKPRKPRAKAAKAPKPAP